MTVSDKYPWLDEYLLSKCGVHKDYKPEWDWTRYMIKDKMLAAFCGEGTDDPLFTMKCEPDYNDAVRQLYPGIITEGYYMNKVHWNSVHVRYEVPEKLIREMADRAYEIILKGFSKKMQNEILRENNKES